MLNLTLRRAFMAAPVIGLTLVLSACGGTTSSDVTPANVVNGAAPSAVVDSASYALPDCTGQDSANCSYNGFDPQRDGFNFENWAEVGNLKAAGLIALFGREAVCANNSKTSCVLYPAAREWAQQINEAMAGGHCEGMAVMAQRLYEGAISPAALDPAAATTFDLALEDPDVSGAIEVWWATQMLPLVQDAYMAFHDLQPSEIAQELANGLQSGAGYTMGIYSPDGAHAITPIAVLKKDNLYTVAAYDNNYPGTVQHVNIDAGTETWSYAAGATNPDAPTGGWEGGIGTIELTPMESRNLPAGAPFDDAQTKGSTASDKGTSTIMATSSDPTSRVGLLVTVAGQTYDTTNPAIDLPAGVMARSTMGANLSGKGMTVTVDRTVVGRFSVQPAWTVPASATKASTPITLSIDAVGSPRITLASEALSDPAKDASFDVDARGTVTTSAAEGVASALNIANGLNSLDLTVPEGLEISVDPGESDGTALIEYVNEEGDAIATWELTDETESGRVVDGVADFDVESGDVSVEEEFAGAEEVNEAVVDSLLDSPGGTDDIAGDNSGDTAVDPDADDASGDLAGNMVDDPAADESSDTAGDNSGDTAETPADTPAEAPAADTSVDTAQTPDEEPAADPAGDDAAE
jgi:hypothetical protein